ncbi:MAG: VacJ family lipoprotein [Steroidobacteraceae bacterium]
MRLYGCIIMAVLALSGCASQEVRFRSWPPETPAADNALSLEKALALAKAASAEKSVKQAAAEEAPVTPTEAPPLETYDPWARLNRFTYRFNARFDEAIFLPVANGYRRLPSPLRAGVQNFFANLAEVDSVINYTLQGRLGRGVRSLGRFVINSTIGLGGLFDVAEKLRLPKAPTGFGTTLAKWGMHPGPYLVIPLYGPSTLREGIGLAGDYGALYGINLADLYRGDQSWGLGVLNAVDQRANIDFRYYASGSPFEYDTIRFLYVRKLLIQDSSLHPPKKPEPDVPAGK